eukprot:2263852-Rhodomonas_salina.2
MPSEYEFACACAGMCCDFKFSGTPCIACIFGQKRLRSIQSQVPVSDSCVVTMESIFTDSEGALVLRTRRSEASEEKREHTLSLV